MAFQKVKVGVVGCGNISYTYLYNLTHTFSNIIEVAGCSDLIPEKSKARAEIFDIPQRTTEELMADPEIEIIVNITEIANHTKVTDMALKAGKHCYSEKMMSHSFEEAVQSIAYAKEHGLRFGAGPDTYLGGVLQSARKIIDDGVIGEPILAQAVCLRGNGGRGNAMAADSTHINGGRTGTTIPYDVGSYYVNAMLALLGPVESVCGYSRFKENKVHTNPLHPRFGEAIAKKEGATMFLGALNFACGCYGSLAVYSESFPPETAGLTIFGTKGNLYLPDPNYYGGWGYDATMTLHGNQGPMPMPYLFGFNDHSPETPLLKPEVARAPRQGDAMRFGLRGIGVADMAYALRLNRPQRCSEDLALHGLEVLHGIDVSSARHIVYDLTTTTERPYPLCPGFMKGADQDAALIYTGKDF